MTQTGSGTGTAFNASVQTSASPLAPYLDQVARLRGKVEKQQQQLADAEAALAAAEAELAEQERTT